jgi:negative elongation factor A
MLSESMKTYPVSGSLNTEISDYDHNESRPIFTDMVTELKRLVNKTNDLKMLPLECQYLNKPALVALVGNQPTPTRHFVLKRKPKSTILRTELMQKSADAQSSLKKTSAPTVPLRSRGLPRKMTDTTPLKGIPSRVPSSGFKTPVTPTSKNATGINHRTTPAGRKDGGVKFLEIEDQPLGYAATKKRKRQQELEEQQKRAAENDQNVKANDANITGVNAAAISTTATPDYAAGLAPVAYSQPATPSINDSPIVVTTSLFTSTTPSISTSAVTSIETSPSVSNKREMSKKENSLLSPKRMKFEDDIEEVKVPSKQELPIKQIVVTKDGSVTKGETKIVKVTRALPTLISHNTNQPKSIVLTSTTPSVVSSISGTPSYVTIKAVSAPNHNSQQTTLSRLNIPSNTIVRTVQYVTTQAQQNTNTNNTISTKSPTTNLAIQKPTLIAKTNAAGKPTILSNIVLTPNIRNANSSNATQVSTSGQGGGTYVISGTPNNKIVQRVVVSSGQTLNLPTLTTRTAQPTIIQPMQQGTPTKIVQIKTTPTILGVAQNQNASTMQNIPPLSTISTQQPTLLNIQNIQNSGRKTVTLTAQQQPGQQNAQGQKVNQILMPSVVKGKTIIVSNQNQNLNLGSRNVILQSVGGQGGPVSFQQIPLTSSKQIF